MRQAAAAGAGAAASSSCCSPNSPWTTRPPTSTAGNRFLITRILGGISYQFGSRLALFFRWSHGGECLFHIQQPDRMPGRAGQRHPRISPPISRSSSSGRSTAGPLKSTDGAGAGPAPYQPLAPGPGRLISPPISRRRGCRAWMDDNSARTRPPGRRARRRAPRSRDGMRLLEAQRDPATETSEHLSLEKCHTLYHPALPEGRPGPGGGDWHGPAGGLRDTWRPRPAPLRMRSACACTIAGPTSWASP